MTREEMIRIVQQAKTCSERYLRTYAAINTPHVEEGFLAALCTALGEISGAEAIAALHEFEDEIMWRANQPEAKTPAPIRPHTEYKP